MLLVNATLVRWVPEPAILPGTAVLLDNGLISAIGPTEELSGRYGSAKRLDAGGMWLLPGLICAHTHMYGAFARGMAVPGDPPESFPEILRRLWWRLDRALGYDDIRFSALVVLADAIRHGVTTLFDHHSSPTATRYSLDVLAEAAGEAGVRASLCYEVSDRDGPDAMAAGVAENLRFLESTHVRTPLLRGMFGLHASMTLSDLTVRRAVEAEQHFGVGFHVHVAESEADVAHALRRHAARVVERWAHQRVLGGHTIAAHCVHVDLREVDVLRATGTRVVHNPRSNMNNAVGAADVPLMLKRHLPVGLGNDGFSQNLFQELQVAYLQPRLVKGDPRATQGPEIVDLLLKHNADTASTAFGLPLGRVEAGAGADLILLRYDPPTPATPENLAWHLLYGLDGSEVDTTVVNGRVLMRHGELQTLDEAAIAARARTLAGDLWRRI